MPFKIVWSILVHCNPQLHTHQLTWSAIQLTGSSDVFFRKENHSCSIVGIKSSQQNVCHWIYLIRALNSNEREDPRHCKNDSPSLPQFHSNLITLHYGRVGAITAQRGEENVLRCSGSRQKPLTERENSGLYKFLLFCYECGRADTQCSYRIFLPLVTVVWQTNLLVLRNLKIHHRTKAVYVTLFSAKQFL